MQTFRFWCISWANCFKTVAEILAIKIYGVTAPTLCIHIIHGKIKTLKMKKLKINVDLLMESDPVTSSNNVVIISRVQVHGGKMICLCHLGSSLRVS